MRLRHGAIIAAVVLSALACVWWVGSSTRCTAVNSVLVTIIKRQSSPPQNESVASEQESGQLKAPLSVGNIPPAPAIPPPEHDRNATVPQPPPSPPPSPATPPPPKFEDRMVIGWDAAWRDALQRVDVFQRAGAERNPMGERIFVHSIIRGLKALNYTRFEIARDVHHLHQLLQAEVAAKKPFPLVFAVPRNVIDNREDLFNRWGACRFLVNDFWGNMPPVRADYDIPGLPLRHFLIPYPDNFVNTFLGFIQDPCPDPAEQQRRGIRIPISMSSDTVNGLIWGKFPWSLNRRHFQAEDQGRLLGVYPKLRLYHSCQSCGREMHHGAMKIGVLSREEYTLALSGMDFLLGLGSPPDGPSALEALSCGARYVNPVFLDGDIHARRLRLVTLERDNRTGEPSFGALSAFERSKELFVRSSQHRYMETFAPPTVYHVHNANELVDAVADIVRNRGRRPFIPHEYQEAVYVQRLRAIVETDYCGVGSSAPTTPGSQAP